MKRKDKVNARPEEPESNEMQEPSIHIASQEEVASLAGASAEGESASGESAREQEPDWKDRFLRASAEFQNLQRRMRDEQQKTIRFANSQVCRSLLEIVDDLERTLSAAIEQTPEQKATFRDGIELIYQKLLKLLKDESVEVIEALGKPFDPTYHEALMQQPTDEALPGTVVQEAQRGYRMHERVLRPARVIVAKALTQDESDRPESEDPQANPEEF